MRRLVDRQRLLRLMAALGREARSEARVRSTWNWHRGHFIPELPGWEERSLFIAREGRLTFHHYDFYAQALAKIERAHARDISDVREMGSRGLIDPDSLLRMFDSIEAQLYRYPAIDPRSFRAAVERTIAELRKRK